MNTNMRFDELFMHEQRIRRTSFVLKIIILVLSAGCVVTYSLAGPGELHSQRLALGWVTVGSQLVVASFTLCGFLVAETTPTITAAQSALFCVLFVASGSCSLASAADADWENPEGQGVLGALVAFTVLAFLMAALHVLELLLARRLKRLAAVHANASLPFWAFQ